MGASRYEQMIPRNGHTLVVGVVARISGCPNQKELSLTDQEDHAREIIAELYDGPIEYRVIATKAKGEALDRPELLEIEAQLRSRELDALVAEDIGRIVRGADAVRLVGIAVDMGTRVFAPNDCIDTADADWEEDVIQACRDHVGHNSHTSKRIKKKKMARFKRFGGATPCEIAGYDKPAGAKTYDDWKKLVVYTPVIQEGLRLLKETLNCCVVADYFNSVGFPPGKYSRHIVGKWDGRMVRRFYKNRLLGGNPGRGYRHTVKYHEKGRRVSIVNPAGPIFIERPHLAHVDINELDDVNVLLKRRNANRGRKHVNGSDPRLQVPRKRTVFPSQHARCFYCGFHYVLGGNGQPDHIMCTNSRDWRCWNSISIDCGIAAKMVMEAIADALYVLEGLDSQFRELVQHAHNRTIGNSVDQWAKLEAAEKKVNRDIENLVEAMTELGLTPEFRLKHRELVEFQQQLAIERTRLENVSKRELQLPSSVAELRTAFEKKFEALTVRSADFGDLLRQLVPEFHVYAVRLLDGGHLMPRARVKIDLAGCVSDLALVPELSKLLTSVVTLDLFVPPQRERIREEAVRLEKTKLHQREIAKRLSERTSQAVVQKALALDRMMKERGLTRPYEVLSEPPMDYPKLRRHRHPRYEFKPLDGYEPPKL